MNPLKAILALLLFVPIIVNAQNYKPGYVVTQKGDTARGYIDLKEWGYNPVSISFKKELGNTPQKFTTGDIAYFEVSEICSYRTFKASISLNEINIQKLQTGRDTSTKTDIVFLKVLQTGKYISLYSYADDIKVRFYVYDNASKFLAELIYRTYFQSGVVSAKNEEAYKQQLYLIAQQYKTDNDDLKYIIENAAYLQPTIEKICKKINAGQVLVTKNNSKKGTYVRFTAGGGLSYVTITGGGNFPLSVNNITSSSLVPFISAGINFYPVPQVSSSLLRLEVMYYKVKNKMAGSLFYTDHSLYEEYTFEQSNFCIYPQLQVSVYNTDPLKIYLNVGASYNLSQYSGSNIYQPSKNYNQSYDGDFLSAWFCFPVKAGVIINKHLNGSISYAYSSNITNNATGSPDNNGYSTTFKEQSINLGISYIF